MHEKTIDGDFGVQNPRRTDAEPCAFWHFSPLFQISSSICHIVMKALFVEQTEGAPGKVSIHLGYAKGRSIIRSDWQQSQPHLSPPHTWSSKSSLHPSIIAISSSARICIQE